jgi:predicted ATPase
LLVEQPEIHLHPAAQADLADLFIDALGQERQFIVETHSEHLVLRIRRRIAEGKLDPSRVRIFFVELRAGKTRVRQLALDDNGHFEKWPKGFFDEGYQEAMAIAEAQIR